MDTAYFLMKILSVFRLAKFAVSSDLNLDSGHLDSEQVGCRLQRKIFGCKEEPFGPSFGLIVLVFTANTALICRLWTVFRDTLKRQSGTAGNT